MCAVHRDILYGPQSDEDSNMEKEDLGTITSDISRAEKVGEYPAETQDTNGGQDNARGRESRVDPYGQGPENKTQFRIIVLL